MRSGINEFKKTCGCPANDGYPSPCKGHELSPSDDTRGIRIVAERWRAHALRGGTAIQAARTDRWTIFRAPTSIPVSQGDDGGVVGIRTICDWECFNRHPVGKHDINRCRDYCAARGDGRTCATACYYGCNAQTGKCELRAKCTYPAECIPLDEPRVVLPEVG